MLVQVNGILYHSNMCSTSFITEQNFSAIFSSIALYKPCTKARAKVMSSLCASLTTVYTLTARNKLNSMFLFDLKPFVRTSSPLSSRKKSFIIFLAFIWSPEQPLAAILFVTVMSGHWTRVYYCCARARRHVIE